MKALLIGYGEIGQAIKEVFGKYHDIMVYDVNGEFPQPEGEFDILLVCIPWQENFIDIVHGYINLHRINTTIIFSTVPIGTTRKIQGAVHAPVEGRHPNLAESISKWQFMLGGTNFDAVAFFMYALKVPLCFPEPEITETAKLASTTLYGINLEFARYINEICKANGFDYEWINDYNRYYNQLYQSLGMPQFSRYLLNPPEGNLGGHCIVNNSKILESQYPSIFNKEIIKEK